MKVLQSIESNLLQQLIDRPDLSIDQPIDIQIALAQDPQTPRSILQILVNRAEPKIAEIAKLHVNYAGELTTDAQAELDVIFQTVQLGQNDRLGVELLKLGGVPAEFLSEWVPVNLLIQALKNPHLSTIDRVKLLARLANSNNLESRLEVAESINTPATILGRLLGDIDLAVRLTARNNYCHPIDLATLIDSQQSIASNWDADPAELAILGKSHWSWIRLAVAQNPSSSADTLKELALDRSNEIQLAIANNPFAPVEALEILLENSDTDIQVSIAIHPNASTGILLRLLYTHQRAVLQRSNLPAEILAKIFEQATEENSVENIRNMLFKQPNTPTKILSKLGEFDLKAIKADLLAKGWQPESRKVMNEWVSDRLSYLVEIAIHPNVSPEILKRLSQCPNHNVWIAIVNNSICPIDLQQQLIERLSSSVKAHIIIQLASNLQTPAAILRLMAQGLLYENQFIKEIRAILSSNDSSTARSFKSIHYQTIALLKQDVLKPAALNIDVDSWMEIIENSPFFKDVVCSLVNRDPRSDHYSDLLAGKLAATLPALSLMSRQTLSSRMSNILKYLNYNIKENEESKPVAIVLASNPHLPTQEKILLEGCFLISQQTIAEDRDCILKKYYISQIDNRKVEQQIDPQVSLKEYRKFLVKQERDTVVKANEILARRLNSPYLLSRGLETSDLNTKIMVARNPNTPISILKQLAKDANETIRSVVSENSNLPLESLLELTEDTSINIRANLARHRSRHQVPPTLLAQLANDETEQVRIQVASNPDTPLEILNRFTQDSSLEVCRALTRNPNVSVDILEILGSQRNIIQPHNIKTPASVLVGEIDRIMRESYFYRDQELTEILKPRNSQIPANKLAELADYPTNSVKYSVALHQNTPATALAKLAYNDYSPVRAGVAENRNTPPEILLVLLSREKEHYLDQNYYGTICHNIANRANLPSEVLAELARNEADRIRQSIVHRSGIPFSLLEWFVENEQQESVLISLANRVDLTSNLLDQLAEKSHPQVLIAISRHPNISPQLWVKLANNQSVEVRGSIASSLLTPSDILELLSTDRELEVRERLAINQNTPTSTLDKLVIGSELNLRILIASNPNTSIDTLDRLAEDEKIEVRRAVIRNPQITQSIKDKLRDFLPQSIIRSQSSTLHSLPRIYNPQTDDLPAILSEYAQSENIFVRLVTLRHPLTPLEILEQGMRSSEWFDRYAVADNSATPAQIHQQLTQDSNQIVRARSIANLYKTSG